jgi:hypothetical protein
VTRTSSEAFASGSSCSASAAGAKVQPECLADTPVPAVKVSWSGSGSSSNSNGDSVGEGFCIRRMAAIVREWRTLRVRIPERRPSFFRCGLQAYSWAQTASLPPIGLPQAFVINGSGTRIRYLPS